VRFCGGALDGQVVILLGSRFFSSAASLLVFRSTQRLPFCDARIITADTEMKAILLVPNVGDGLVRQVADLQLDFPSVHVHLSNKSSLTSIWLLRTSLLMIMWPLTGRRRLVKEKPKVRRSRLIASLAHNPCNEP
jgi:hypothetical protein